MQAAPNNGGSTVRTKPHTVRALTYNGRIAVKLVKQIGGDWGYTLPSGRRIVQLRDDHTAQGREFQLAGDVYPTLTDACVASGEMK
jgi:hypothetical protein